MQKIINIYSLIPEQTIIHQNTKLIFKNNNLKNKEKSNIKYDKILLDVDDIKKEFKIFPMDDIVSILNRTIWIKANDLQGLLVVSEYNFPYSEFSKQEQCYFLLLYANYLKKKD